MAVLNKIYVAVYTLTHTSKKIMCEVQNKLEEYKW